MIMHTRVYKYQVPAPSKRCFFRIKVSRRELVAVRMVACDTPASGEIFEEQCVLRELAAALNPGAWAGTSYTTRVPGGLCRRGCRVEMGRGESGFLRGQGQLCRVWPGARWLARGSSACNWTQQFVSLGSLVAPLCSFKLKLSVPPAEYWGRGKPRGAYRKTRAGGGGRQKRGENAQGPADSSLVTGTLALLGRVRGGGGDGEQEKKAALQQWHLQLQNSPPYWTRWRGVISG